VLARGGGRGVVLQRSGPAEGLLGERCDRHALPTGQVRRRDEDAALRVERPAAGDADGADLQAGLGDHAPPELEEPLDPLDRPAQGVRRLDRERVDTAGGVDDAGCDLRAADIEPEHGGVRGRHRSVRAHGGGCAGGGRHQPFRPWVAMPSTK
jgi:hypothetical protein